MIRKNIKKILVPMDGSKNSMRGLDEAIYLARQCHATITGLYVIPLAKPMTDSQISYLEKYLLNNASKFMSKAKTRAAQNGILFDDAQKCIFNLLQGGNMENNIKGKPV